MRIKAGRSLFIVKRLSDESKDAWSDWRTSQVGDTTHAAQPEDAVELHLPIGHNQPTADKPVG